MSSKQISTRFVEVNSKNRTSGTCSNFSIDFKSRDLDNVVSVTMIQATLPRMFQNIQSWNNTIFIANAAPPGAAFTIPVGQYNITQLIAALNIVSAGPEIVWTYNATTERVAVQNNSVFTLLIVAPSSIGPYIGLTETIILPNATPVALQAPPFLSGPDSVYIKSNLVAASSTVAAGDTSLKAIIGNINFSNIPYGYTGRMDSHSLAISSLRYASPVCMRKIDVQIVDAYENVIECPENCYLDMVLQFISA